MRPLLTFTLIASLTSVGCGVTKDRDDSYDTSERVGSYAHALSVQDAVSSGCSTSQVEGLSLQIIAQGNCIEPDAYAELSLTPNANFGSAVLPFMQKPGRDALAKALSDHSDKSMQINSMLRTVAQQYLLYRWYQQGKCGIGLAAKPGSSNHETGLAIDLTPYGTWKPILESTGFAWLGASDPVHFDYKGPGTKNLKGVDVLAFQQLWNDNHPEDEIDEDGLYGPQTEARLEASPAEGFPNDVDCGDGRPPVDPGDKSDIELNWSTDGLQNVYTDGPSATVKDVFLDDRFQATLQVKNASDKTIDEIAIALKGDGRLTIDNGGAEASSETVVDLGSLEAQETKEVPLNLIASGYSVDGLKPASMVASIDESSSELALDVYDVKRAEFNGERFEGWRAIGEGAKQRIQEGALVLEGAGPRLIARSADRQLTPRDTIEIRASRSGEGVQSRARVLLVPADPEGVALAIPFDLPADGAMHEFVIDVPARAQSTFVAIEVIFFDETSAPTKPLSATLDYLRVDKTFTGTGEPGANADGCSIAAGGPGHAAPWQNSGALAVGLLLAAFGMRRRRRAAWLLPLSLFTTACSPDFGESVGTVELPLPKSVCADGLTAPGIDVSYYQGDIDWDAVAADEVAFAITRVNHGSFMDPQFDTNWKRIREVGLLRGAYQYFNPGDDPVEQAQTFIDKVGVLGPGDLPGVIDVESTDDLSPEAIAANVGTWLDLVEAGTGRKPIIYTGGYFWNGKVKSDAFKDYPLWTAHYTSKCPYVPDAWEKWAIWQYTSSGSVDGIAGNVDRNRFNGSLEQLNDFAANGYRAQIESLDYPSELEAGETGQVTLVLKNVGARTWIESTRLGTTEPRDRSSAFVSSDWLDPGRVFAFTTSVESGQTVEIAFDIVAPEVAGDYVETFNLVEEGIAWFSDINPGGGPMDDAIALSIRVTGGGDGPGSEDDGAWNGEVVDLSLSAEVSASCGIAPTPLPRRKRGLEWAWGLAFALPLLRRRRRTPQA